MGFNIAFALVLCVFVQQCISAFTVQHVNFIQAVNGNYLFRGGIPNYDGQFQYDILVNQMRTVAEEQGGVTLPDTFYMIDINLLNPADSEITDIITEVNFFGNNTKLGSVLRYPIYGEVTNPFNYTADYIKDRALTFATWSVDKLPAFVEQIHSIVSEKNNSMPTVSYIHCECGCDRTGEVSGSYYMRYMNMSLHDAHALDEKIAGREIELDELYALNWYCFYLKYALNYDLTCDQ
jgi:protein-tyrosine phosphatase